MKKLICFGDSITAGEGFDDESKYLVLRLQQTFENWTVINAGVSGDNSRNALARVERDVVKFNPDIVTVLFGANDAATHKMIGLTEFESNLTAIVSKIGPQKTILISPAPVDEGKPRNRTNAIMEKYADRVRRVSEQSNCGFIDLFREMFAVTDYGHMLSDGLHFSEWGYELLSELIVEKIRQVENYGNK